MDLPGSFRSAILQTESACSQLQHEWTDWGRTHAKTKTAIEIGVGVAALAGALALRSESLGARACETAESVGNTVSLSSLESEMGARAAQRIKDWYPLLPPRLGAHLTDPNVVLTLADARGQTEFFIRDAVASDVEAFDRLSQVTKREGIAFRADLAKVGEGDKAETNLLVNMHSLKGYQRVASQTRLPGISNQVGNDWRSVGEWVEQSAVGLRNAQRNGLYPADAMLGDLFTGVRKGFPDRAIMSFVSDSSEGMVDTKIPFANYYAGSPPNYCFLRSDAAEVSDHSRHWGSILERYYRSPEHRALEADMKFMQYRQPELMAAKAAA